MSAFEESGLDVAECPLLTPSGHRASYAAEGLRIPNALIARSFMSTGSRTPVAVTLTTDLTINSVIGSSRLVTQRSINAPSYAAVATLAPVHNEIFGVSQHGNKYAPIGSGTVVVRLPLLAPNVRKYVERPPFSFADSERAAALDVDVNIELQHWLRRIYREFRGLDARIMLTDLRSSIQL